MDVIADCSGNCLKTWKNIMWEFAALAPDNLTVHTLSIKKGSRLKYSLPEHQITADTNVRKMLEIAADAASRMHMRHYY